jgi:hypothetical protein
MILEKKEREEEKKKNRRERAKERGANVRKVSSGWNEVERGVLRK